MVCIFTSGIDLAAGEVIVEGEGLLGRLEALELTGIQAMAAGFMNMGFPITCNGANLAYRRSAFLKVNGFEGIGRIVSGDDDLLMQKIARETPSRVIFVTGRKTAVVSKAVDTPGQFVERRVRWASKTVHYPSHMAVLLLSAFFLFFTAVPVGIVLWFFGLNWGGPLVAGIVMKTAGDMLLTLLGTLRVNRVKLMAVFPIAEILHIPYIIGVTLKGVFGSFEWRGRVVKAYSPE
jgi:hypothetical protein